MANIFKTGKMLSNDVNSYLTNAIADFEMPNGSFVVLGELAKDDTYESDGVEYDTYQVKKVADATKDEVVAIDSADICEGEIGGNNYKMGIKLYNLVMPAKKIVRARRLALHDKFWLAEGNFNGEVSTNKYAILENGKMTLKPAATAEAEGFTVKILTSHDLTAGMGTVGTQYLCEVIKL